MHNVKILHAPSPLGLKPPAEGKVPGVRLMPQALAKAGLHARLRARLAGEVTPPAYDPTVDPELGMRNAPAIAEYSVALADRLSDVLDQSGFMLVLGGDCSIFLGAALALRRLGRFGVVYIDAHSDCQTPSISQTGGVAGMPLALATGRGPAALADLEGLSPYVEDSDVWLVGCSDLFDVVGGAERFIRDSQIRVYDLDAVRRSGPTALAESLLGDLHRSGVDAAWVHFDVDVLDQAVMPAVDSPEPRGLSPEEVTGILSPLVQSPIIKGMEVTIYDPERDPEGIAASVLVDLLADALAPLSVRG